MKRSALTLVVVVSLALAGCNGAPPAGEHEVTPAPVVSDAVTPDVVTPTERPRRAERTRTATTDRSTRANAPPRTPTDHGTATERSTTPASPPPTDRPTAPTRTATPTETAAPTLRTFPPGVSVVGVLDANHLANVHERIVSSGGFRLSLTASDCDRCRPTTSTVAVGERAVSFTSPHRDTWDAAGERAVSRNHDGPVPYSFAQVELDDPQSSRSHDLRSVLSAFDFEVANTTTRNRTTVTTLRATTLSNPTELPELGPSTTVGGNATLVVRESGVVERYAWSAAVATDRDTTRTVSETLTVEEADGLAEPDWVQTARDRAIDVEATHVTDGDAESVELGHVGGDALEAGDRVELYRPGETRMAVELDERFADETASLVVRDGTLVVADQPPTAGTSDPLPFDGGTVVVWRDQTIVAETTF